MENGGYCCKNIGKGTVLIAETLPSGRYAITIAGIIESAINRETTANLPPSFLIGLTVSEIPEVYESVSCLTQYMWVLVYHCLNFGTICQLEDFSFLASLCPHDARFQERRQMYADRRLSQSGEICQPLLRKASLFKKAREDFVIGPLPDEREKDFFRGVNSWRKDS